MGAQTTAVTAWWRKCSTMCFTISFVCLAVAAQPLFRETNDNFRQGQLRQLAGSGGVMLLVMAAISFDMSRLSPSGSHSYTSLLMHYSMTRVSLIWGRSFINNFIKKCGKVGVDQVDLLDEIIHENKDTQYGKQLEFVMIRNYEDYIKRHPLVTYQHYKQYIDLIVAKNQPNLLCKLQPLYLATTSGTTGPPKVIPLNSEMSDSWMNLFSFGTLVPQRKGLSVTLCKHLRLWYEPRVAHTPGGLMQSVVSYFLTQGSKNLPNHACNPLAFSIKREQTAFYVQAVFALSDRDLGQLEFSLASQLLHFWHFVCHNADVICAAIETGSLSKEFKLPDIKTQVLLDRELRADPVRARDVRAHLDRGTEGLARRLWPCLQCARVVVTGSQKLYAVNLANSFMKDVPMLTLAHAGSEAIYGFNISAQPDDHTYALAHTFNFFEFIPEAKCSEQQPETVLAHKLEIGQCYEIVVTTKMGLYRYRTGDVIKVVAFEQQCPVYEFMYRLGQLLNLADERTDEHVVQESLLAAARDLGHVIHDFTTSEDVYFHGVSALKQMSRCYVLFLEIEGGKKLNKKQLSKFDEKLCEMAPRYAKLRKCGGVAALEIIQVKQGTFMELERSLAENSLTALTNMPRVLRNKDLLDKLKAQAM